MPPVSELRNVCRGSAPNSNAHLIILPKRMYMSGVLFPTPPNTPLINGIYLSLFAFEIDNL